MPTKPSPLLPIAGRAVATVIAPSPARRYFLVSPRSKLWVTKAMPCGPKKIPKSPSNDPVILLRKDVMSAVPRGMPVVPTTSPPFFLTSAT